MHVKFQFLPKDADFPDEITVSDAAIENVEFLPNVGDYVLLTQTHPEDKRGTPRKFVVVSRNFGFLEHEPYDTVTLVVSDYEPSPITCCRE